MLTLDMLMMEDAGLTKEEASEIKKKRITLKNR